MTTAGTVYEALLSLSGGACGHFRRVDATNVRFIPWCSDRILINGVWREIPAAGLTITNAGLAANTLYYVFAYWTGSALAAEFAAIAVGHGPSTVNANAGAEIKTGDETRSLIGFVRTDASSQFVDTENQRWVRSWFNRHLDKRGLNFTGATASTVSTTAVLMNATWKMEYLLWANEVVTVRLYCSTWNNTNDTMSYIGIGWDGLSLNSYVYMAYNESSAGNWHNASQDHSRAYATDGYHYATAIFWTVGGLFVGAGSPGPFVQLNGRIG